MGSETEIGLGNAADYFRAVKKRAWMVAALFFAGAAVAFLASIWQSPEYSSMAKVLIKSPQQQVLSQLQGLQALAMSGSGIETEIQVIRSRTSVEQAMDKLNMDVDVIRDGRDTPGWRLRDVFYRYTRLAPRPDPALSRMKLSLSGFSAPESRRPFRIRIAPSSGGGYEVFDLSGAFGGRGASLGTGSAGQKFTYEGLSFTVGEMIVEGNERFTLSVKERARTLDNLMMKLAVKEAGFQSGVVNIGFSDTNPQRAADFINEIVRVYEERSLGITQEKASQTLEFINGQLAEVESVLGSARDRLDAYKSEKGTILLSEEAKGLITQTVEAETKLEAAKFELDQTRKLKNKLVSGATEDYILSGTQGQGPVAVAGEDLFGRLIALELERSNMLQIMTPSHKDVKIIEAKIKELKGVIISNLDNYISVLNNQIADYGKISGGYRSKIKGLPQTESELTVLSTELEVNYGLYKALRQQKQDAEVTKASEISRIYVLDPAVPPYKHSRPRRLTSTLAGGAVGLFLGAMLAIFLSASGAGLGKQEKREAAG